MDSRERSPSTEVHKLTWDETYALCNKLIAEIRPKLYQFCQIKAIANGGIIPAAIIAYELKLDLEIIDEPPKCYNANCGKMVKAYHQEGVLLIDDVYDTGETICNYIENKQWFWQGTAALIVKSWCPFRPEYMGQLTDKWIVFPWET